ncbi:MAG: hypothetical protein QOH08_2581 [Chloroflexota bacterium]|jgi:hypothetical protein|nr:hypothetical protein [Chloroflexota bacterium]
MPAMVTRKAAPKTSPTAKRADAGVDRRYFAQQPPAHADLLEALRLLVMTAIPDATVSIKWGVPFYAKGGKSVCALAGFKDNVAINFFAPPDVLSDPRNKLEGEGKRNRMLKVRGAADIDRQSILRWLKATAAANG